MLLFSYGIGFIGLLAGSSQAVNLIVSSSGGNDTSPLQYGIMIEDINHSIDGGLYAELIQNRAFQGSSVYPSTIDPWTSVGPAVLLLSNTSPTLSSALPTYLKVTSNATAAIGVKNPGWWGIDVQVQTYTGKLWASGTYTGNFTATLESAISNDTWATVEIVGKGIAGQWTEYHFTLEPTASAPNSNNTFSLTWTPAAGQTVNIGFMSLFPPTYKNR